MPPPLQLRLNEPEHVFLGTTMKRLSSGLLVVGSALLMTLISLSHTSAQKPSAVPVDLETVGGNYVILDLGGGRFAFYAHLRPGSIRVRVRDRVRRGQVLALLGNCGNSDAPHLHFHVTDGDSPLGAEGVPYVFESFDMQGVLSSKNLLVEGGWKPQPITTTNIRRLEIPVENAVVRFP